MKKGYRPGDRVVIREWDNMQEQFGLNRNGNIPCKFTFVVEMKQYCGMEFTLSSVEDDGRVQFENQHLAYNFSTDMIIPFGSVDPMEAGVVNVDIDEFLKVVEG